jgi:hypothetical protein
MRVSLKRFKTLKSWRKQEKLNFAMERRSLIYAEQCAIQRDDLSMSIAIPWSRNLRYLSQRIINIFLQHSYNSCSLIQLIYKNCKKIKNNLDLDLAVLLSCSRLCGRASYFPHYSSFKHSNQDNRDCDFRLTFATRASSVEEADARRHGSGV